NNTVQFFLADFVGNYIDSTYSFDIIPDDFPPYLNFVYPMPGTIDFNIENPIEIDVLDRGMGIKEESIEFYIYNERIAPTNYSLSSNPFGYNPDSLGFHFSYTLQKENYYPGQQIVLRFVVEDLQGNNADSTFSFFIAREPSNDIVEVVPTTITLNGDGYNDQCKITISSNSLKSQIVGKIFDRRGKTIKLLNVMVQDENTKYAIWDGTDKNNLEVSGGVYIYQIKVKNKTYQGSIVVAK
ncbi:MAG: hypothetical protein DRZ79_02600, partial [Candidatus Cloacimonadota bacterium]